MINRKYLNLHCLLPLRRFTLVECFFSFIKNQTLSRLTI
ncbi:hypothetical protein EVA_09406 [gut metagenome]|uniref:Uncharacterized protein n=1 Tax=gut metagenome TaxID=749906 RepID=J9G6I4_9ZZZZ